MGNKFREFLNFVNEITGRYPEDLADSFRDIFIYIPNDKTPPNSNDSFNPKPAISIFRFFSNRNTNFCNLIYNEDWNELEDHLGSDLLRFCLTECILAKRTKGGSFMVSNLLNLRNKITADPIPELNEIFFRTDTCDEERRSHRGKKSAKVVVSTSQIYSDQPVETNGIFSKTASRSVTGNRLSSKRRKKLALKQLKIETQAAIVSMPQINLDQPPELNEILSETPMCNQGILKEGQSHGEKKSAEVVGTPQIHSDQPIELYETFPETATCNQERQCYREEKSAEVVVSTPRIYSDQPVKPNGIFSKTATCSAGGTRLSSKRRKKLALKRLKIETQAAIVSMPQINLDQPPELNEILSGTATCNQGILKERQSHGEKKSAEVVGTPQIHSDQPIELYETFPETATCNQERQCYREEKSAEVVVSTPRIYSDQPVNPNGIFSKTATCNAAGTRLSSKRRKKLALKRLKIETQAAVVSMPQINLDQAPELNEILSGTATCNQGILKERQSHGEKTSAEVVVSTPQINLNQLFCPIEIEYTIYDVLPRTSWIERLSCGYLQTEDGTGMNMSLQVLKTRVGSFEIFEYENCVGELEQLLNCFKRSDSEYNYAKVLNELIISVPEEERKQNRERDDPGNHLSSAILRIYFEHIFHCVIPESLIGGRNNKNQLKQITCSLLEISENESLSLRPYIQNMEISEMPWLNRVQNINVQWCILGKLLKWIMDRFILEICREQLYTASPDSSQNFFFNRGHSQRLAIELFHKKRNDKVIVCTSGLDTNVSGDGRLILLPTENGVKPTIALINKPGKITKTALCYLQQLYATKYGDSGKHVFLEKWKNLVQKFRNDENKTRYIVRCSVQNAYESVDQRKLLRIVESLANLTGPEPKLRYYRIARNLEAVKSGNFEWKKCFSYPEFELPIASESIFAWRPGKVVKVSKEVLLYEIKRNILNQNIRISNERYLLQEGIAEGATMSSVLCDIYYAHMEEANLSQFKSEGFLYRHMGDFLFVTEDKALAERFLQHISKGFLGYNCSFDAANIISNVPGLGKQVYPITYLGFKINPGNLEMVTKYLEGQRSTITLSKPCCNPIETFREKLSNLTALEIDGVLDCAVNSEETIINNLTCIFMVQADRCMWLLNALSDDIYSQLTEIFDIIKSTNLQIIRHVQRNFLANGCNFEKLVPQLAVIPWRCYVQIFRKYPEFHAHFRPLYLG